MNPHTYSPESLLQDIKNLEAFDTPGWTKWLQEITPDPEIEKALGKALTCSVDRLELLEKELENMFHGKGDIIRLIFICAIAQEPMLLFGPPGTAKSAMITRFAEGLGVQRVTEEEEGSSSNNHLYFEYLLNQFSEPDELLGPVQVSELTRDDPRFRRFRKNMLTEASIAFLDEIFRANSSILNALLSLINERQTYEAGTTTKSKLLILFGAANSPPNREDLAAFYERFPIRIKSNYVPSDTDNRLTLLQKGWKMEVQKGIAGHSTAASKIKQMTCLNDLLLCNRAGILRWNEERWNFAEPNDIGKAKKDQFIQAYNQIVMDLARDRRRLCYIDDRKYIRLYKILRAKATYEHKAHPVIEDLDLLKHTWHDFDVQEMLADQVRLGIQGIKASHP